MFSARFLQLHIVRTRLLNGIFYKMANTKDVATEFLYLIWKSVTRFIKVLFIACSSHLCETA